MLDSSRAKIYFNFNISKQKETKKTFDISKYASQVSNERQNHASFSVSKLKLQVEYSVLKPISNKLACTSKKYHIHRNQIPDPPQRKGSCKNLTSEEKLIFFSSGITCAFNFIKHTSNTLKQYLTLATVVSIFAKRYLQIHLSNKGNV